MALQDIRTYGNKRNSEKAQSRQLLMNCAGISVPKRQRQNYIGDNRAMDEEKNTTTDALKIDDGGEKSSGPAMNEEFASLMEKLQHISAGQKYGRDEMNERWHVSGIIFAVK